MQSTDMANRFCSKCGAQLTEGKRFCSKCGRQVRQVAQPDQIAGTIATETRLHEDATDRVSASSQTDLKALPWSRIGLICGGAVLIIALACAGIWLFPKNRILLKSPTNQSDVQNDNFWNALGRPQHDLDQMVLNVQIPSGGVVNIDNPRGDVSITAADGQNVHVQVHEIAFANSDDEAKTIFDSEAAHVTVSGSTVLVQSAGHPSGRLNLTVSVPKTALVTVNASHGDVTAAGLGSGANLTAGHGDIHLTMITGSVQVHFSTDKGDFSAHRVTGDITADGRCNDLTLSEVKGGISVNGDIFGEVHLENVSGPVHLHTSVTDLQFGSLPGDMTMDEKDLRMTEAKGNVRVVTHAKNVDLSQIYGDTYVDDRDANISIAPAGPYGIQAMSSSGKGNLDITLPPNASATIDGRTHKGDILSDYPLDISGGESKTVTGRIGGGTNKIILSTDVGDLHIKKGQGFPGEETAPTSSEEPAAPSAHLKPRDPVKQ